MICERCGQGERTPVTRAKLAESDGKVAVVLGVPMEECHACGSSDIAPPSSESILTARYWAQSDYSRTMGS